MEPSTVLDVNSDDFDANMIQIKSSFLHLVENLSPSWGLGLILAQKTAGGSRSVRAGFPSGEELFTPGFRPSTLQSPPLQEEAAEAEAVKGRTRSKRGM